MDTQQQTTTWHEQARFSSRMMAQIRMIEQYRYQRLADGRLLSLDQAAAEWIARFAADIPQSFSS